MDTASSEDDSSLRDHNNNNNVDLNDETLAHHLEIEVNGQLSDTVTGTNTINHLTANPHPTNVENLIEPFLGMEFESEEAAKLFYMSYASRIGFSVRISKSRRSRNDESIIMRRFVCSKEGFHLKKLGNSEDGKKKRKRATIREGCNAMIEVIQKYYGRWVVTKLVKDHNHVVEAPSRVRYIAPEEYADLEPLPGMEFPSHEAAQTFYYAYASRVGFDVRIRLSRRSTKDESFVMRRFVCTKEGFTTPLEENFEEGGGKKKRNRTPTREGCKAMFEVIKKDFDKWIVSKLVLEHTHDLALAPNKVHYIQSQSEVVVLTKTSACPRPQIGDSLGTFSNNNKPASYDKDFWSETNGTRAYSFGLEDTQKLLGYFKRMNAENPTFSYAVQVDKDNCLTHAFWADARARASYYYFGDSVTLDTSFKMDKDLLPFVTFTGVNHHFQSVLFGCALLTDCTEDSFLWLFESWAAAMGAHHPTSLKTVHNEAFGPAARVFPETRHRFCQWHILDRCKERLANVYSMYPSFEGEFQKVVNGSDSVETFDSNWRSILDKYNLLDNHWLQYLHNIRERWVPAFFKDAFTAEISINRRPESLKESFFDKYFNMKTPLPVFITLLDHVMAGWSEKESIEDLATSFTKPILRTPSNLLKQVSEIYTRSVFNIFQEEFIESLGYYVEKIEAGLVSKYIVAKEDDGRSQSESQNQCQSQCETLCTVTYDFSHKRARCSCSKFETCGILCRHVLRVFLTVDVRALPEFYILKRWTKEAKNGFVLDESLRYNELYRDAVRFAREASTSGEVFNFAQQNLQVAFAEIINIKQDIVNRCAMR